MVDFSRQDLERVVACVGERDPESRASLVQALRRSGLREVRAYGNLAELRAGTDDADLIFLGDDLDPNAFGFLRELRHNHLALNPFAVVACVEAHNGSDAARQAVAAGADHVIARPLNTDQLFPRLRLAVAHRRAFIATSDYVGPDRRVRDRGVFERQVAVPNPFIEGDARGTPATDKVHQDALDELLRARLAGHGYRFGFLCRTVKDDRRCLEMLLTILADAARTATRLNEDITALACWSLRVHLAAVRAGEGSVKAEDHALMTQIAAKAASCLQPEVTSAQREQNAVRAAASYDEHPRDVFPELIDFLREPTGPEIAAITQPVMEISEIAKGGTIFRQGEPATAAYFVVSGEVALYRDRQGQQLPVAKIHRGEVFGDMVAVDGTPRRVTAIAATNLVIGVIDNAALDARMRDADPAMREFIHTLGVSLRMAHEVFTPKSRHVSDSVWQMIDQVAAINDYIQSPGAPAGLKAEGVGIALRLQQLTEDLVTLIAGHPTLDRRTRALPEAGDREPQS